MAKRGRPLGGHNQLSAKPIRDAIRLVVAESKGNKRTLRRLAERIYDDAMAGSVAAQALICDRLEGKAPQSIGQDADLGPVTVRWLDVPQDAGEPPAIVDGREMWGKYTEH